MNSHDHHDAHVKTKHENYRDDDTCPDFDGEEADTVKGGAELRLWTWLLGVFIASNLDLKVTYRKILIEIPTYVVYFYAGKF